VGVHQRAQPVTSPPRRHRGWPRSFGVKMCAWAVNVTTLRRNFRSKRVARSPHEALGSTACPRVATLAEGAIGHLQVSVAVTRCALPSRFCATFCTTSKRVGPGRLGLCRFAASLLRPPRTCQTAATRRGRRVCSAPSRCPRPHPRSLARAPASSGCRPHASRPWRLPCRTK
jgi:hypothetical protein